MAVQPDSIFERWQVARRFDPEMPPCVKLVFVADLFEHPVGIANGQYLDAVPHPLLQQKLAEPGPIAGGGVEVAGADKSILGTRCSDRLV